MQHDLLPVSSKYNCNFGLTLAFATYSFKLRNKIRKKYVKRVFSIPSDVKPLVLNIMKRRC